MAVLSGIALVLVLAGVYSVIAQSVVQRQLEMAIRAALGAEPWRVLALAMRTALLPAMVGIAGGILGGLVNASINLMMLFDSPLPSFN